MAAGAFLLSPGHDAVSVIETTVDGRYQVIARIASGGMGEVYRAHDAVLGREVALKVLHPQLAGDRGFVERFRREARAAALLNHPNVVGVYDWGNTEGTYFMIMEFVSGTNLRALLTEYGRLEPGQVLEVTLAVLAALDHAHGHGIVHRDVKPENILIARNGTVKVADFGLARAYADSYISQAEGTVTGTVQYLAPEQIQGEPADPRTDLYALGVVMFELLTGRAPFTGETSLSIAYQHLSGSVPAPSEVVPALEPDLDRPVLQATAKDRNSRPASARAMRETILQAGVGLPPTRRVADLAGQIPSTELAAPDRAATVTIPRRESPKARRSRRLRVAAWLLALLVLLGGGGWAGWVYVVPHYTRVPDIRGLPEAQAISRLKDAGLSFTIGPQQYSSAVASGTVISTIPAAGARTRTRTKVQVITSKGPEFLLVPDVLGDSQARATEILTKAGFSPVVAMAYDDAVRKGRVIRQDPDPSARTERGSTVTLTISLGPSPIRVPDLKDQPAANAQAALVGLGFTVTQEKDFSDSIALGKVIRTDPPAGASAPKGSDVILVVSKGPRTFPMPGVVGQSRGAATAQLEALGLSVNTVFLPPSPGSPPGIVVYQGPAEGTPVHAGSQVTIYVSG
jgi:beta-lactam-binding protein with PASTA domain/predicted Ser/Thr protein kinase